MPARCLSQLWVSIFVMSLLVTKASVGAPPELIVHHGKLVTVDGAFSLAEAMSVREGRIVQVGDNATILATAGNETELVDLGGRTVLPGLIDSHVHPTGASLYEFDHPIPEMETIADVLAYVKQRADQLEQGEWVYLRQVFITRLRDQRYPTRYELDQVAPNHPVMFATGPDAAVNSLALELNGIDKDFEITDGQPGYLERDPDTGELTGILRSCSRLIKRKSSEKGPTAEQRYARLKDLFAAYNEVGLTSVSDRAAGDGAIKLYEELLENGDLTCRVYAYYGINAQSPIEEIASRIEKAAAHPRHAYDPFLRVRGVKIFLDGGMLTGSAYMRRPWGVSQIYSISDPEYRGLLYVDADKLYAISKAVLEHDLQMTAHSVGDGAVDALIAAYRRIDESDFPVAAHRPCITHCNFMSTEAIAAMRELGIVADLQPAWLHLDGATLLKQFGTDRMRYFQPYKSVFDAGVIVGGGSDHMQKIGSMRAVNPYNPFWGMWVTLTRTPRWADEPLHPEERISREQAIRLYTTNNAFLTFEEDRKGSLEAGKFADFIVLDTDILTCPLDDVKEIQVQATYMNGRKVFSAKGSE